VVPCFKVSSALRIKSAVDRTPFHNEWLGRHFLKELSSEVRLVKQFCKGQGVYGSDTRTQGFSGYLCELLIMKYRTFKELMMQAPSWKACEIVINLEGIYPITDVKNIHKKFPKQPLMVIDPVDPGRNVAAALSPENFIRFRRACSRFNKMPSKGMFFSAPLKPNVSKLSSNITSRGTALVGFSCPSPKIIEDVLWPQLRRTSRRIKDILEDNEFDVFGSFVWADEKTSAFVFEIKDSMLPRIMKLRGPSVFAEDHCMNFLAKYSTLGRVWVEGEFWMVEIKRKHRDPIDLIKSTLTGSEKELKAIGIASYFAKQIPKSKRVMKKREIIAMARKSKPFGKALQDMLEENLA